jgi:hypothetical protein
MQRYDKSVYGEDVNQIISLAGKLGNGLKHVATNASKNAYSLCGNKGVENKFKNYKNKKYRRVRHKGQSPKRNPVNVSKQFNKLKNTNPLILIALAIKRIL